MVDLSVPAVLAKNPSVGWLDLPLPRDAQLALILDDEELTTVAALRLLSLSPHLMAGHEWGVWRLRDPSVSIDHLLDEMSEGASDLLLLSFGCSILAYVEMHSGTVLVIYSTATEAAVRVALGAAIEPRSQQQYFDALRSSVSGEPYLTRAEALLEHWKANQYAVRGNGS